MKKKEHTDHISTLLGVGTTVEGNLAFNDTIRLDGKVSGKINSEKGTLIVGETGGGGGPDPCGNRHRQRDRQRAHPGRRADRRLSAGQNHRDIQAPVISIENGCGLQRELQHDQILLSGSVEKKTAGPTWTKSPLLLF